MKTLIGFMGLVFFVGCGSDSPGSVSGTVHGMSIPITDAVSASVTTTSGTTTVHGAFIFMANASDLCADATTNTSHPNEKGTLITLFDINGTTFNTPTAAGAYTIYQGTGSPPPKAATLGVSVTDATCMNVTASSANATTGTVNLTAVSGNAFDGNFDVVLDSGDHITGSFTPRECPAIQTAINSMTKGPCT